MNCATKTKQKIEFGDFETPFNLAQAVCETVADLDFEPCAIVEPTCGTGNFLAAALEAFPAAETICGFDISPDYAAVASARFGDERVRVRQTDFFETNWQKLLSQVQTPVLVVGNLPWVTNAGLSRIDGKNQPEKSNFQNFVGLDALTGKSNFDVSEWMLIRLFEALQNRRAVLAMLCKTATARKLFVFADKHRIGFARFEIRRINALAHFGAATDACLLVCDFRGTSGARECRVYKDLEAENFETIAVRGNQLVASLEKWERTRHLNGNDAGARKWRSGVKHDCAKVMELTVEAGEFRNGFGETVEIEDRFVYPLLKSSDLARGREPRKFVIVTQKKVGEDTARIAEVAPRTWAYLCAHADLLDKRGSSIYRNRPRFSIFGVGDYSFADWKVAISGLYKKLVFRAAGNQNGKPIMLDDTCYFLLCASAAEARRTAEILNSETSREFYESLVFWDAKRPITVEILQKLNLSLLDLQARKLYSR